MLTAKCRNKKCKYYDEDMISNCSKGEDEPWFPECPHSLQSTKLKIFLDERPKKTKYPHKPLPTFSNSFWEPYSLTVNAFKTLTPFQKENIIQEFSELINTLSVRLRLLISIK